MKFDVIGFENKEKWHTITKNKEVYYQWEYIDAFYKNNDGIPQLAYAEKNNEYIFYPFLLRNISKDLNINEQEYPYFDIVTTYGYGGLDCTKEDSELLEFFFINFEKYCNEKNIISEFIRFSPFLGNHKFYNERKYNIINISKTVYIKLESEEQIWNDFESRCRNTIRKAQKNNLIIKNGFDEKKLNEFIEIYKETMKRDNADKYYFFNEQFFESIYNNLGKYASIYTVLYNNKPISSSIILFNGESAHYHLSGTLTEYLNLGANSIGLYEIAKDLCKKGCKSFHLGGGYGGDTSPLLKFKRSFNKNGDLDFYIGKRIYNNDVYNKLCNIKGISIDEPYFPAYRKELN